MAMAEQQVAMGWVHPMVIILCNFHVDEIMHIIEELSKHSVGSINMNIFWMRWMW